MLARYALSTPFHGTTLPWVTVAINVVGSFLLGMLVTAHGLSDELRTALAGRVDFRSLTMDELASSASSRPGVPR